MDSDRWKQVDNLLHSVVELPPGEREAFLRQACAGDEALEREIRSLLASDREAVSFLERPAIEVAAHALATEARSAQLRVEDEAAPARPLPAEIGPYRIVRLLGEGGMGVVYEAVQEHPHRTVALKVVKPGLAPSLLRRFEHESQALARLQHPGIAQIHEAGVADTGFGPQPYFAMEFIRGQPFREYTEAHHLGLRERLVLMVKICQAVEHAHQRGLIHRDLKPGNILVDETGQPKILDFGVARVTDSEAQVTRQTDVGQLVGTLEYMSPEQVLADPAEIDTRSDVYALGVILYEVLAGRRPYKLSRQLHEAVQTIREEDPAPLSAVSRDYRGDIETIAAKALEKDKSRRYGSAAALAADIERHLADEPILARPASTAYQLQKFARRNKALVSGVAAVFVVLAAGIVASTWEAARTRQERDRAVAERQRANNEAATAKAVTEFLQNDLLAQASDATQAGPQTKPDPDLKVRTALDRAAARIAGKFDQQPLVEASIRQTIGETYVDLGLWPEARHEFERAFDLRARLLGENHPDTLKSMQSLANQYRTGGDYTQAERLFTKVVEAERRVLGEQNAQTLAAQNVLSRVYIAQGKYEPASRLLTQTIDGQRRALGAEHADTLNSMDELANLYRLQGRMSDAEQLNEKVLETKRRVLGEEHPYTLTSMNNLAIVYGLQGKYGQAESLLTKDLEIRRRVGGEHHPETLTVVSNLGELYRIDGKYAQAEPLLLQAVEGRKRVLGRDHPQTLTTMGHLARLYQNQHSYAKAEQLLTEVLEGQRRAVGREHPNTISALVSLGQVRLEQHGYTEAEPLLREAIAGQAKSSSSAWQYFDSQSMLGAALAGERKFGAAEPLLLSGYEGLVQRKASIPASNRAAVEQAGERIVQLYQAWGNAQKTAEWSGKIQHEH